MIAPRPVFHSLSSTSEMLVRYDENEFLPVIGGDDAQEMGTDDEEPEAGRASRRRHENSSGHREAHSPTRRRHSPRSESDQEGPQDSEVSGASHTCAVSSN